MQGLGKMIVRKLLTKVLVAALPFLLFIAIVIPILSIFPSAGDAHIDEYKHVAEVAGVDFIEMIVIDTVKRENDFNGLTTADINYSALEFMSLSVGRYKQKTFQGEMGPYKKWVRYRTDIYSGADRIISFLADEGYSNFTMYTMEDILSAFNSIDVNSRAISIQVNYRVFEDVVELLDDKKKKLATDIWEANIVGKMFGELKDLEGVPEFILVDGDSFFTWPVPDLPTSSITSYFGPRSIVVDGVRYDDPHKGIDIAGPRGTPIVASASGRVVRVNNNPGSDAGLYVVLEHVDSEGRTWTTRYLHMSKTIAVQNDNVEQGEVIGLIGTTGQSTGNHLHFDLKFSGQYVDPLQYIGK